MQALPIGYQRAGGGVMGGISIWQLFILLILAAIYMLPTIVASRRNHRNTPAIAVLNVLLGWSLIGWAGALVWACLRQEGRG